jgi:hypothetical protein
MIPTGLTDDAMKEDLPPETVAWIETALAELEEAGVEVRFVPDEYADCAGYRVGGWFDENGPEFVVAVGRPTPVWLSVFVHEFMHFRQSRQKTDAWEARLAGGCCPQEAFDAWLAGVVEMKPEQLRAAVGLVLAMERECETMALDLLSRTPELPIDREWYTSAANVYLGYYGVVMRSRRWYDRAPYTAPELLDLVPGGRLLTVEEMMEPGPEFEAAIRQACYVDAAAAA